VTTKGFLATDDLVRTESLGITRRRDAAANAAVDGAYAA
jgi:hypothetical protein